MEPSHHGTQELAQHNDLRHVSYVPQGSPSPMAPQYVHAMPAVTTNYNYNKEINNSAGNHRKQSNNSQSFLSLLLQFGVINVK